MSGGITKRQYNAALRSGNEPCLNVDSSRRGKMHGNGSSRYVLPISGLVSRVAQKVLHDRVPLKVKQSTRPPTAKFSDDQVRALRRLWAKGASISDLALVVGMANERGMENILDGTNYSKVF